MLRFMERAASQGGMVYAVARCQPLDLEFTLRNTALFDKVPSWKDVLAAPHQEKVVPLNDAAIRARLRVDWANVAAMSLGMRPERLEVDHAKLPQNRQLEGQAVAALADRAGKDPVDYLLDLALEEDLFTRFIYKGAMNGDMAAVEKIITGAYCLPGVSDAGAHLTHESGVDFSDVLLGYWVRERHVLTLEEGVRRLTSMSARLLGIADRGLLKEGLAADIVVFDPAGIRALPKEILADLPGGGERIIQRAAGIKAVVVNGQLVIEDGRHTGATPGVIVSPGARSVS